MSGIAPRLVIAAMLMSLALGVTGCGSTTPEPSPPAQSESTAPTGSPTEPSAAEPATGQLDAQAAADAALAAIPGSAVVEIDRGTESGRAVWDVVVRNSDGSGTELYIDEATGDVLKQESAEVPPYASASAPAITASAAMAAALSTTPGTVVEVGLGREGGGTVWEVLVSGANGRVEHYIDATTGAVIKKQAK